jgi:hypothetical protein
LSGRSMQCENTTKISPKDGKVVMVREFSE